MPSRVTQRRRPSGRGRRRESCAVHDRPVARRELGGALPVARHRDLGPSARALVSSSSSAIPLRRISSSASAATHGPGSSIPIEPIHSARRSACRLPIDLPAAVVSSHVRHRERSSDFPRRSAVSSNDRRTPRLGVGLPPGQAGGARARDREGRRWRAAVRRRVGLREHRDAAARERPAGRPRRDLPRRAGAGEDPHDPLADRPARRVDADRRRQ